MFTSIVYAQGAGFADSAAQIYSPSELLNFAIALLLFISIILTIGFVLWGGFLLVISGGDEHKVHPAINMIRYSVIGLLIMLVIILIIPAAFSALGFDYIGQNFRPGNVFQTMKCVSDRIFGKTDQSCLVGGYESDGIGFGNGSGASRTTINTFGTSTRDPGNSPNGAGEWTQNF